VSVGLLDIASFVPPDGRDVPALADALEVDRDFLESKLGTRRLPVMDPGMDTHDLATAALLPLLERHPELRDRVGLLMVVTQNPSGRGLPHTAAMVHHLAELPPEVAAFDLSLGCSGYVHALAVAQRFLQGQPPDRRHGLVVTADPYSKVVDPGDRNTALLFGDAAAATLLGPDAPWSIGHASFLTRGAASDAIAVADGRLAMKGRSVFDFAMKEVPRQVSEVLDAEGESPDSIDVFLLHQGSRYLVESLGRRLGAPPERVPVEIGVAGNTVSSSLPLMMESRLHDQSLRTILLAGFGVGLSSGTLLLRRREA
jgi:3-oxoacyl-[acyl-carrier-protein] synthase-3